MTNEEKMRAGERIQFLIERDGKVCRIPGCKRPTAFSNSNKPTTDHTIPLSKGGPDTPDNWKLAHEKCNQYKADRLILEDGTLEPIIRKVKEPKAPKRSPCEECMEGRLLLEDENCPLCGIGPMPAKYPRYAQKNSKDCPHAGSSHCWLCVLGFVERVPASSDVFGLE